MAVTLLAAAPARAQATAPRFSVRSAAAVNARIPHPFEFEAHREIRGTTARMIF